MSWAFNKFLDIYFFGLLQTIKSYSCDVYEYEF